MAYYGSSQAAVPSEGLEDEKTEEEMTGKADGMASQCKLVTKHFDNFYLLSDLFG
jgi:hypothetical protein